VISSIRNGDHPPLTPPIKGGGTLDSLSPRWERDGERGLFK
jgi:hypothetical protein